MKEVQEARKSRGRSSVEMYFSRGSSLIFVLKKLGAVKRSWIHSSARQWSQSFIPTYQAVNGGNLPKDRALVASELFLSNSIHSLEEGSSVVKGPALSC